MIKKKKESASFGVIGLGRFGTALAITLAQAGKEVIAVDRDESRVKELRQYTDYAFVADSINSDTLKEIGIQNCDVVAVCIGEKIDASILITMSVIDLGVPKVIAKASSVEQGEVLKRIGATVVYPEKDMAVRLGNGSSPVPLWITLLLITAWRSVRFPYRSPCWEPVSLS